MEIENSKKRDEISQLSNLINAAMITDDKDCTTRQSRQYIKPNPSEETSDDEGTIQIPAGSQARMLDAQQASRFVRILRRRDDQGVEEFIKSVRYAKSRCDDKEGQLYVVLNEKIIENAERNIRFQEINTFEDLYKVLRTNMSTPTTVSHSRAKLQSTKQNSFETVQTFTQRFTQVLSELRYATQVEHTTRWSEKQTGRVENYRK